LPEGFKEVGVELDPSEALRLVLAQDLVGLGTWEYDRRTQRSIVSPSLRKMMDLGPEGVRDYREKVHQDDLPKLDQLRKQALETPGIYHLGHRIQLASGDEMFVHSACRSYSEEGSDGEVTKIVGAVLDVTDRKRMEQALAISEERWQLALRGSNEGVWDWDLRTNSFFISSHLAAMLGISCDESGIRVDNWSSLIHPEDRGKTMRAVAEHLEGRTSAYSAQHRIRHADGAYRWLSARGSAIRDIDGKVFRLIGVSTDVTERRSMEIALREREDLLKAAVEGSFDSFFILKAVRDHDGRIEDFEYADLNRGACEFTKMQREAIIGRTLIELFPQALEVGQFDRYVRVAESRIPLDEEFCYNSEQHSGIVWIHQQVIAVRDGVAVTIADITERKRAEQAVRENQWLVERIASSVPEFICIFDIARQVAVYRNRSLLKSLDYDVEDPPMLDLGTLARIVPRSDLPLLLAHFEEIRHAMHDDPIQVQLRMTDGEGVDQWFLIRSMVFQRGEDGMPTQALASAQHITDIKQYEIRLKEQMVELQAARAELEERQVELVRLNEKLEDLASRDGLTDVYNHRAFQDRLVVEVARSRRLAQPLSIVMTDVDNFKAYNDRFGHPAGDERLKEFARTLLEGVRSIDIVARYGGEEFAVILPNTTVELAASIAERMQERLNDCKGEHCMTASFGCAELDTLQGGEAQMIRDADAALYRAKSLGKNRVEIASHGS